MTFDFAPLLGEDYLRRLYGTGSRSARVLLRAYLRRALALLQAGRYDLLWVQKELFPGLPAWGERLLAAAGIPYVVDYDDATFVTYRCHPSRLMRSILGRKIDAVMAGACAVVAGNDYLARYARSAGAKKVAVVPTLVQTRRYTGGPNYGRTDRFTIGWIGSPSTAAYIEEYRSALAALTLDAATVFRSIGAWNLQLPDVRHEALEWSEETEVRDLTFCDAAIAPLRDGQWERGKCGYKILQCMAAGLPVVASPVGMALEIVTHGTNGFFAATASECERILKDLRRDPALRQRIGQAARRTIEERFSVVARAPELFAVLRDAVVRDL
jgi:glycosyltransferase involved in cell wall biosynthesis